LKPRRLLLAAVAVALAIALGTLWWRQLRPLEVALPVLNHTAAPVQVLFYGAGLAEHVLIKQVPPNDSVVVTLRLAGRGPIRVQSQSARAQIDSELLDANSALRRRPQQFDIGPGNQWLLTPRR
jgi:hypothetical protein